MKHLTFAVLLACLPLVARAESPTVTLTIENDAGMVTQVADLTARECDALVTLLVPKATVGTIACPISAGCNFIGSPWGPNVTMSTNTPPPQPHTSRLTSAKCLVPANPRSQP